jgi:adenylate cyclase
MSNVTLPRDFAFRFEAFRVELRDGLSRLNESGRWEPVALGSRALDVLVALAMRHGELITKQTLMELVWPTSTVEDANLTVQIAALRRALDQDRGTGSCIQTVIGRGYRFLPAVTTESDACTKTAEERVPAASHPILLSGPTVAVLPFNNFSRDPRWDRFCDGLVEDIITSLARQPDLLVIARQSSFAYKGRTMDIREIGNALGARYIVEGSVQAEDGRLKVTAQLINSMTGMHIWADRYSRDETDFFVIQEEIVDQIIAALAGFGGSILRAELTAARRKPPVSLRAYELYLLGYEQESRLDRDGTLRSIEILEAAVEADPHLSRAWTVLGWAYSNALQWGWADDVVAARARAREAVLKAVELDPVDSLALATLTALRAREGDFVGARATLDRALAVGTNDADSLVYLARFVATIQDRPDAAMALVERSFALNPHAPAWYFLFHIRAAFFARRFELVLNYFARLTSDPVTSALPLRAQKLFWALALTQLGREAEAALAVEEFDLGDPNSRMIPAERACLCPAAQDLFLDGLRKAGINGHR